MRFGRDSFLRSPANILFAQVSQCRLKAQKLLAQSNGYKQPALKAQKLLAQGNGYKQHALKGQKLLAQGNGYKQHALKGQKLIAQGNALGIMAISNAPCKGKSFKYCQEF